VLAVLAAAYVWLAYDHDFASRAMPWMAGVLALVLALIDGFARGRRAGGGPAVAAHAPLAEAIAFAWIGAFLPLVVVLGFYGAIVLYVFCYLRLYARKSGLASAAAAFLVAGFLYVVFDTLMGYEIFGGLLGGAAL
jgi:hypothetical protein